LITGISGLRIEDVMPAEMPPPPTSAQAAYMAAPGARPAESSRAEKNRNTPRMDRVLERPDGNR
jgi:hypothetical protein